MAAEEEEEEEDYSATRILRAVINQTKAVAVVSSAEDQDNNSNKRTRRLRCSVIDRRLSARRNRKINKDSRSFSNNKMPSLTFRNQSRRKRKAVRRYSAAT